METKEWRGEEVRYWLRDNRKFVVGSRKQWGTRWGSAWGRLTSTCFWVALTQGRAWRKNLLFLSLSCSYPSHWKAAPSPHHTTPCFHKYGTLSLSLSHVHLLPFFYQLTLPSLFTRFVLLSSLLFFSDLLFLFLFFFLSFCSLVFDLRMEPMDIVGKAKEDASLPKGISLGLFSPRICYFGCKIVKECIIFFL